MNSIDSIGMSFSSILSYDPPPIIRTLFCAFISRIDRINSWTLGFDLMFRLIAGTCFVMNSLTFETATLLKVVLLRWVKSATEKRLADSLMSTGTPSTTGNELLQSSRLQVKELTPVCKGDLQTGQHRQRCVASASFMVSRANAVGQRGSECRPESFELVGVAGLEPATS